MNTLTEAKIEIERLNALLSENGKAHEAALNVATSAITAKDTEIQSLKAELESERGALTQMRADLDTSRKSITSLNATIESLEKSQISAESQAAKICASVGVSPLSVTPAADNALQAKADLLSEYRAIQDPALAMTFYRKHRHEINAAALTERKKK